MSGAFHFSIGLLMLLLANGAFGATTDYNVGMVVSMQTGGAKTAVSISPSGAISYVKPGGVKVTIEPKVTFVIDESGAIKPVEITVGGAVSIKGTTISSSPRIIVDTNGKSWFLVPDSYMPKIKGLSTASALALNNRLRAVVDSMNSTPFLQPVPNTTLEVPTRRHDEVDSTRRRGYEPITARGDLVGEECPYGRGAPLGGTSSHRITELETDPRFASPIQAYTTTVLTAWNEYLKAHPELQKNVAPPSK